MGQKHSDVEAVFRKYDKDKDGLLTLEDFEKLVGAISKKSDCGKTLGLGGLGAMTYSNGDRIPATLLAPLMFNLCHLEKSSLGVSLPELKFYCQNRQKAQSCKSKSKICQSLFKVNLCGDAGVGKTNLMSRFCKGEFHPQKNEWVDFLVCYADYGHNEFVKFQVWDQPPQEKFRVMNRSPYGGSCGAVLMYDMTDQQSFGNLRLWRKEVERYVSRQEFVWMIVGTKADLPPTLFFIKDEKDRRNAVERELGLELENCYFEVSLKTGRNVNEMFLAMGAKLLKEHADPREDRDLGELIQAAYEHSYSFYKSTQQFFIFRVIRYPGEKSCFAWIPREVQTKILKIWLTLQNKAY